MGTSFPRQQNAFEMKYVTTLQVIYKHGKSDQTEMFVFSATWEISYLLIFHSSVFDKQISCSLQT